MIQYYLNHNDEVLYLLLNNILEEVYNRELFRFYQRLPGILLYRFGSIPMMSVHYCMCGELAIVAF